MKSAETMMATMVMVMPIMIMLKKTMMTIKL